MCSVEEKVEDFYKQRLTEYGVRVYGKNEKVNTAITKALKEANSKQGGEGFNYPDIKLLLEDDYRRAIPVMIEAKGLPRRLEKIRNGNLVGITYRRKDGKIGEDGEPIYRKGDPDYSAIANYAVNGALHYGKAILDYSEEYDEVIIVGLNGTRVDKNGVLENPEHKAYYVSKKNNYVPKHIKQLDDDLILFSPANVSVLFEILDSICLSEEEIKQAEEEKKAGLEKKIKVVRQYLYDDPICKKSLGANEKLYLLIGLIVAGVKTPGVTPLSFEALSGNNSSEDNDGKVILGKIKAYLSYNGCSSKNIEISMRLFEPVFAKKELWQPVNDESTLKRVYKQICSNILPFFEEGLNLSSDSPLMNALTTWANHDCDVVFPPLYVTAMMARLARVSKDSVVFDPSMAAGTSLASALSLMLADASEKIADKEELEAKIESIKSNQIVGIESKDSLYGLALLTMILMGNPAAQIANEANFEAEQIKPDVLLMSPSPLAPGKGLSLVSKALSKMPDGYACVLMKEVAGGGLGGDYAKDILKNNSLIASIRMSNRLFLGEADTQTAIFLLKTNRPHEEDDLVSFIDFSNDGYSRHMQRRLDKKAVLTNADCALERYEEVVARIVGKKTDTAFYTEENGLLIRDTISLDGGDWTYKQHVKVDLEPSHEDFVRTTRQYVYWKLETDIERKGVQND